MPLGPSCMMKQPTDKKEIFLRLLLVYKYSSFAGYKNSDCEFTEI